GGPPVSLLESEGEADELRVVVLVLCDRDSEIDRERHLARKRQREADPRAHAGTDCTEPELRLNVPRVGEEHAAEVFAKDREADLDAGGGHEVAADGVLVDS